MVGRLVRFVVGLVVLVAAADIWRPSMVPHGVPIRFGDFEDIRIAAVGLLVVVGGAFILAAILPTGAKRKRAIPMSM